MKYFLDTEFIEDGKTIDLISIAIVREDGKELYCINQDAKLHLADNWIRKNVLNTLPKYSDLAWMTHSQIRQEVEGFLFPDKQIELWAYYADYDWVAFCQLFGKMIDLPPYMPKFCMDLKQLSVMVGSPQHPKQKGKEHNALDDARYNKELYDFLITKLKG